MTHRRHHVGVFSQWAWRHRAGQDASRRENVWGLAAHQCTEQPIELSECSGPTTWKRAPLGAVSQRIECGFSAIAEPSSRVGFRAALGSVWGGSRFLVGDRFSRKARGREILEGLVTRRGEEHFARCGRRELQRVGKECCGDGLSGSEEEGGAGLFWRTLPSRTHCGSGSLAKFGALFASQPHICPSALAPSRNHP